VEDFFQEYFVRPILERTGYNAVNTLVYAAIAIVALYALWRALKGMGVNFAGKDFLHGLAAFVLLGSTSRVITDLWDAGLIAQAAEASPIYAALYRTRLFEYGYLTVTPGIYIVVAALFLLSLAIGIRIKNGRFPLYAGLALWLPCFLLLIPFIQHFYFGALAVAIAAICSFASFAVLEKILKQKLGLHEKLAVAGQALDGAATFVVIDIFSKETGRAYFEQHVLSAGIGTATPLGFGLFLAAKVLLASLIVYLLRKEDMEWGDKALVLAVVGVMGFAPGIRDLLRMLAGA